jgi:hypothetical protein
MCQNVQNKRRKCRKILQNISKYWNFLEHGLRWQHNKVAPKWQMKFPLRVSF